jgi:hypothetical protein
MSNQPTAARVRAGAGVVTRINVFTVDPSEQQQLVELWQAAPEDAGSQVQRGPAGQYSSRQ